MEHHHRPHSRSPRTRTPSAAPRPCRSFGSPLQIALALLLGVLTADARAEDSLDRAKAAGVLRYGTDTEGGAPYIYPDPADTRRYIGFEKELMDRLAARLGLTAQHDQENWDRLLSVLAAGRVDVVCNGFERTDDRLRDYIATRPYYVYQLQLLGRRDGRLDSWDDFRRPKPGGGRWRIGVLTNSVADRYLGEMARFYESIAGQPTLDVVKRDAVVDALREVENRQLDGTLQDDIAARFFLKQPDYRGLRQVGPPQGGGDYVIYLRKEDARLRDELDRGIQALLDSGELKSIYDRYGLWTPAQEELVHQGATVEADLAPERGPLSVLRDNAHFLLHAAGMTIVLSVASMPIAMIVGLLVALARMYGPPPLQWLAVGYVEFIRGTPLMLQLFVLYFLLPEIGIVLPDLAAGILGLALNYSAYEAEIYRTGLQAVPHGQMEAALALGMSRPLAIRRVILPQAIRIVIPPVTSDFITLLKDSSVCSAIGLVELSKQYSILVNNNGHVVMFAAVVALIYLVLSLPLSRLAHILERRLDTAGKAR